MSQHFNHMSLIGTLSIAVIFGGMADASAASRLQSWKGQNHRAVDARLALLADLEPQERPNLAMLSVAVRELGKLVTWAWPRGVE